MHIRTSKSLIERRRFFKTLAATGGLMTCPGLFAEALELTPGQGEGPFYPLPANMPLGKDNDLVLLNDRLTPASGTVVHVFGRVVDRDGKPAKGALVELWHTDNKGVYTWSQSGGPNPQADPSFAGFGQYLTEPDGRFRFRTIKPGLYPGRTRHFHWGITLPGQLTRFTTQSYWKSDSRNESDILYRRIPTQSQKDAITLDFSPLPGSEVGAGEEFTEWDIVVGAIPEDVPHPSQNGNGLEVEGQPVTTPDGTVFKLSFQAVKGYSYEVYSNPEMRPLSWQAVAFSLSPEAPVSNNIITASSDSVLELFVKQPTDSGFYFVAFRVPGANTGTPS